MASCIGSLLLATSDRMGILSYRCGLCADDVDTAASGMIALMARAEFRRRNDAVLDEPMTNPATIFFADPFVIARKEETNDRSINREIPRDSILGKACRKQACFQASAHFQGIHRLTRDNRFKDIIEQCSTHQRGC